MFEATTNHVALNGSETHWILGPWNSFHNYRGSFRVHLHPNAEQVIKETSVKNVCASWDAKTISKTIEISFPGIQNQRCRYFQNVGAKSPPPN